MLIYSHSILSGPRVHGRIWSKSMCRRRYHIESVEFGKRVAVGRVYGVDLSTRVVVSLPLPHHGMWGCRQPYGHPLRSMRCSLVISDGMTFILYLVNRNDSCSVLHAHEVVVNYVDFATYCIGSNDLE